MCLRRVSLWIVALAAVTEWLLSEVVQLRSVSVLVLLERESLMA